MTTTRGQHLIGKEIGSCVLERLLGYGGSSAVFLARSLTSEEQVAVKVFLPRSTLDGQMRKSFYRRFLREAEAASQLDHSNILSIYAYGEHDGMPYIVMPYMPGGTLAEYVQQHGPLSLKEALRYLEQVAAALDYAHAHGCIHCDVKPANILLDGAGRAALSDFGIVRLVQTESEPDSKNAKKAGGETLMGTPDYISPEQALGENLDQRSDVYSLGATLYALLTGEPPFKAETLIALALMHVHEPPTPPGLLRADVTPQIDFVLSKALAKWPEERFQTAGAFCMAFALAVKEAEEAPQFSLKSARVAKAQTSDGNAPAALFATAQPIIQIKPVAQQHYFNPWRIGLALGLAAVLLLGGLLTALFIGTLTAGRARSSQQLTTPTGSSIRPDALAGDQQNWQISSTFFFQQGAYHIQNKSPSGSPAMAFYANHQFTDFHLQVTTREITRPPNSAAYYGVAFRASTDQSHYYLFDVTTEENSGYVFWRYDGGTEWVPLAYGPASGLLTQAGQQNVLSIEARQSTFTFFINGKQVGKPVHDRAKAALLSGGIGLVVEEKNTEVAFSQLYITAL